MGVDEWIKNLSPSTYVPSILGIFVTCFIAPKIGITDQNQITLICIVFGILLWIFGYLFLYPQLKLSL